MVGGELGFDLPCDAASAVGHPKSSAVGHARSGPCIFLHQNSSRPAAELANTNIETGAKVLPGPGSPPDVTGGEAPRLTKTDSS